MAEILKGKISSIESEPIDANNHATTAKVVSLIGGAVTRPLVIPWYLRGTMGNLAPETEVVYVLFEDKTGYILGRFDGNFQDHIPYNLIIDGNITQNGDTKTSGNVSAADFVSAAYGSTNEHAHTDSQGGTTTPPN
ncbi:MAG: pre-mRNA-splicing factor [Cyanobacteria bacterium SIG32]|nr:pre-mRNA-splicing factor [Cyanobacteria bacterium SIG32]